MLRTRSPCSGNSGQWSGGGVAKIQTIAFSHFLLYYPYIYVINFVSLSQIFQQQQVIFLCMRDNQKDVLCENVDKGRIRVSLYWRSSPNLTYHPYLCGDRRGDVLIVGPIIHPTLDQPGQTSD